jgi:hypothetical protein
MIVIEIDIFCFLAAKSGEVQDNPMKEKVSLINVGQMWVLWNRSHFLSFKTFYHFQPPI